MVPLSLVGVRRLVSSLLADRNKRKTTKTRRRIVSW